MRHSEVFTSVIAFCVEVYIRRYVAFVTYVLLGTMDAVLRRLAAIVHVLRSAKCSASVAYMVWSSAIECAFSNWILGGGLVKARNR